jgi:hypothetical protein
LSERQAGSSTFSHRKFNNAWILTSTCT